MQLIRTHTFKALFIFQGFWHNRSGYSPNGLLWSVVKNSWVENKSKCEQKNVNLRFQGQLASAQVITVYYGVQNWFTPVTVEIFDFIESFFRSRIGI